MKKLCFITTVSTTVHSFLLPVLSYYAQHTDWELTVVCDHDPLLQEELPEGVKYYPIPMKRGISLGGIAACWKMYKFFRKEKFDLVVFHPQRRFLRLHLFSFGGYSRSAVLSMGYGFCGHARYEATDFQNH